MLLRGPTTVKNFPGTARGCRWCDATGLREGAEDRYFPCYYCRGTGIAWGVASVVEWSALGKPLGLPIRLVRSVQSTNKRLKQRIAQQGADYVTEELWCLLMNAALGLAPPEATGIFDVEDPAAFAFPHPASLCEVHGLPFLLTVEHDPGSVCFSGCVVLTYEEELSEQTPDQAR